MIAHKTKKKEGEREERPADNRAIRTSTAMYLHPITGRQLRVLEEEWGVKDDGTEGAGAAEGGNGWFEVVRPMEKALACGDVGVGAMRAWEEVVEIIEERMGLKA